MYINALTFDFICFLPTRRLFFGTLAPSLVIRNLQFIIYNFDGEAPSEQVLEIITRVVCIGKIDKDTDYQILSAAGN